MGAVGGVAILGGNFEAPQFPEDKFIQRSLTVGDQETSPIDAVILDAPALGAPGQRDSHATIWKGHSNDGSPHTIDWKLFVDVTADDGTGSLWTLQTRIDAAAYATVMTIDDNGLLTVSGATFTMDQLIIDSDNTEAVLIRKDGDAGDVFIVDTINDVVRLGSDATTLTFGASSDAIFKYIGPGTVAFDDDITEPFFQVVSGSDNTIGGLRWLINDRFQVGTFAGSPRNVQITRGDVPIIEVTNAQVGFGTPGTPGDAIPLVFIFGNVPEDIIIMDTIALTTDGQRDSHSILWTGKGFESATPHDIDWKQFVDVTADDGTGSLFTWQTRIDAAGYGTRMTLSDVGEFTIEPTNGATDRFFFDGGTIIGATGSGIWLGQATPTANNFALRHVGTDRTDLNAEATLRFLINNTTFASTSSIDQQWTFNRRILLTVAGVTEGIILDSPDLTSDGTQDSHSLMWTAQGFESSTQHDVDWKAFVRANNNDGTLSDWVLQARIDAASFVDEFTITATTSPTVVNIGPGSTGSVLAFGPIGSDGPAQSGTIRLKNVDSIFFRNQGDDGDLSVIAFDDSNQMLLAEANIPRLDINAGRIISNRIRITQTSGAALEVNNDSNANMFEVDTSGNVVTVGQSVTLQVATSVDRFIITGQHPGTTSTAVESHTFLIQGRTRTSGAVDHTSDWRMVVQPFSTTAFDGQSQLAFVGGIDGASLITPLKLVNDGRVAINQPEQVSIGSPTFVDNIQLNITGNFVDDYGGGPTETHKVKIQGSQTGDSGRTVRQTNFDLDASIITQNLSQTINEVGAMFIDAPGLTIGTDTVNIAYALKVNNNPTVATENYGLLVDSGSPATNLTALTRIGKSFNQGIKLLVGGGVGAENIEGTAQMRLTNFYTPDGLQTEAMLFHVHSTLQATDGTTDHITGAFFEGSLRTQVETESVSNISQVRIDEPNIQDNLTGGGVITNAQSLLITGAPTEGASNWAFRILSGDIELGGDLIEFGAGGGNSRMLYRGCSTFYIGNLDSPDEMFFGLGSTVTVASAVASWDADIFKFRTGADNGQFMAVRHVETVVSTPSGSSATAAGLIPAGSFVIGVTTRVQEGGISGPAGFDVGDGIDVDRWGNSLDPSSNAISDIRDFTSGAVTLFPTANDVVITSDGVDFTGGSVRITVHYLTLQAPTS